MFNFGTSFSNLGQIKDFQISLRDGINHKTIQEAVIQNEIEHNYCQFCVKSTGSELGMKMTCMVDGCSKSSHPSCSYLNGCMFDIVKEGTNLQVGVVCSEHVEMRDHANQVYLRRFFSDYKGTSNLEED